MAQLSQRLRLDLADTLTGDVEFFSDFLQGARPAVDQTEAELNDLALPVRERLKRGAKLLAQHGERCGIGRGECGIILDKVSEMAVVLLTDRCIKRYRISGDLQHLAHTRNRHVQSIRHLLRGRFAPQLLQKGARHAERLVDCLHHMHRHSNGPAGIRNAPGDCLADPPGCVRTKFKTLCIVELVHRFHQSHVAFLNQIQERHPAADVFLGNADNQTEIRLDQTLLRLLVTLLHSLGKLDFFLGGKQRHIADFLQIHAHRILYRYGFRYIHILLILFRFFLFGCFLDFFLYRFFQIFVLRLFFFKKHLKTLRIQSLINGILLPSSQLFLTNQLNNGPIGNQSFFCFLFF